MAISLSLKFPRDPDVSVGFSHEQDLDVGFPAPVLMDFGIGGVQRVEVSFGIPRSIDLVSYAVRRVVGPSGDYPGPYVVEPAEEEQVLLTNELLMQGNVVINPIPSNYGRIEWNGVCLMVI